MFPLGNFPCHLLIVGGELGIALALRNIVLVAVVSEHPVGGELTGHLGDGVLDVSYPLW